MSADTQTILSTYIAAISKAHATGKATEHSYRPAIKALVEGLAVEDSDNPIIPVHRNRAVLADFVSALFCVNVHGLRFGLEYQGNLGRIIGEPPSIWLVGNPRKTKSVEGGDLSRPSLYSRNGKQSKGCLGGIPHFVFMSHSGVCRWNRNCHDFQPRKKRVFPCVLSRSPTTGRYEYMEKRA